MEGNRVGELLNRLQSLDEPTKRKVLVGATAVIMIVVVFVWIAYFNTIVIPSATQAGQASSTTSTASAASAPAGPGFWKGLVAGFEGIGTMLFHGGHETIQPSH